MTITFTPATGSSVPLATTGREGTDGLAFSYEDAVQVVRPLRAPAATQYHRGGRLITIGWTTTREHASQEDADAFALAHASRIPTSSGTLILGGSLTLTSAVVRIVNLVVLGVTSRCTYSASGAA